MNAAPNICKKRIFITEPQRAFAEAAFSEFSARRVRRAIRFKMERFVKRSFKGNARFLVVQKSRPDTFHLLDYPDYEWIHGHGFLKKRIAKDPEKSSVVVVKPEHPTPQ